jgi:uncharacterized repeat protein (TIGR01451 family)
MKNNSMCVMAVAAAMCALTWSAWAQEAGLSSKLTAYRVDTVQGKPVLKPAVQANPGDTVEYTAVYTNKGQNAAQHLQATVPIPVGTQLLENTAKPLAAQGSTDGVNFSALPLKQKVLLANGAYRQELVALDQYRALRWDVGTVAPSKEVAVSLRVRINSPVTLDSSK